MRTLGPCVVVAVLAFVFAGCPHHGSQPGPSSPGPAPADHTNPDPGDASCTGQPNDNSVCDRHLVACTGGDSPTPEKNCEKVADSAQPTPADGGSGESAGPQLYCCDGA